MGAAFDAPAVLGPPAAAFGAGEAWWLAPLGRDGRLAAPRRIGALSALEEPAVAGAAEDAAAALTVRLVAVATPALAGAAVGPVGEAVAGAAVSRIVALSNTVAVSRMDGRGALTWFPFKGWATCGSGRTGNRTASA
jgi:hypothetical protein